ncbi:MAG: YihY family inner membrane protein [bacterium]|nr:YihY family inner membrane protein [bacterium]
MAQGEMTDPHSETEAGVAASLRARWGEVERFFERELWLARPDETFVHRGLRSVAQLIVLTVRGFYADHLLLRASALTYVTALSIIPMLGVVIAIVGAVGGDETLIEFAIDQLTTVAPEVRETVREFAGKLDFASFGTVGGAVVFGTAIFALRHLEATLNDIWGVASARSWARRFSDYLAVLVVAPVSTGVAVSLATTLQSNRLVGRFLEDPTFAWLYGLGLAQVPVFVLFLGFTFLYWFFPNTQVRIRAAALGGLVAAILFSAARTIYVDFQVGAATYETVFGALSAIPLILAWLYACWAVLLLGAEVAFAAQNLAFARREMRYGEAGVAEQEAVALEIAVTIARCFREHATPPDAEKLADLLDEPVRLVRRLCEGLEEAGLVLPIATIDGQDPGYVPAGPIADITAGAVLRAARGDVYGSGAHTAARTESVARVMERLEGAWGGVADETSLAMLTDPPGTEHSE